MAVHVDASMVRAAVVPELYAAGEEYVARGRVGELTETDGGLRAVVTDPADVRWPVWAGIVDRELAGHCDCPEARSGGLCEHALAVALAALDDGFAFTAISSWAAVPSELDADVAGFAEAAGELTRDELVELVSRYAAQNRPFAALMLAKAGRLRAPGMAEIQACREVIADAAAIPNDHRWELHDLVKAGYAMVTELELLVIRPATAELLAVVEEAIGMWDSLVGYLYDAWETYETEPEEIGAALAGVHVRVCEELRPEPRALARRLAEMAGGAEYGSFMNAPDAYRDLLGTDGLAEFTARTRG